MKNLNSLGLKVDNNKLWVLDQTKLPHEELWLLCESPKNMVDYIKALKIRGAPLIGVGAALALARYAEDGAPINEVINEAKTLRQARPTAVNLMAAVDRVILNHNSTNLSTHQIVRTAEEIFDEDVKLCASIAEHGSTLIKDGDSILTHCNSGGLATAGIGTALGIVVQAHLQKKKIHVYVDETRPLLQGARLTAWELEKRGIPYTLICDNMSAMLMSQKKIDKIFVGADRIAKNGDFANKIGTYAVAVSAKYHNIPFYVAAPQTTVDKTCLSGNDIPIELRAKEEVRSGFSPNGCNVYNPAFDVTPISLVTATILDTGIIYSNN